LILPSRRRSEKATANSATAPTCGDGILVRQINQIVARDERFA
jgi:hypothetical protein